MTKTVRTTEKYSYEVMQRDLSMLQAQYPGMDRFDFGESAYGEKAGGGQRRRRTAASNGGRAPRQRIYLVGFCDGVFGKTAGGGVGRPRAFL